MEDRKFVIFLICFLIFLFVPVFVLAYSDKTTHPALTDEIIDLFNYYYPDLKISDADKAVIKQGSIDEDAGIRSLNHFYDPIYNRGIFGNPTSKNWSQNTLTQAGVDQNSLAALAIDYFSYKDDFSWERAIFEFADKDKTRGLLTLGHILHLLEDAAVPDHTRNDAHPLIFDQSSPYEEWTSQFTDQNFSLADKLIKENQKPIIYSNLNQYFDNDAIFSNNNFFSKDTIFDKKYFQPISVYKKIEQLSDGNSYQFEYGKIQDKNYKLLIDLRILGSTEFISSISDSDYFIISDYWNFLSRQAVLNGAGVVKLFFDEVEKEKNSKVLLSKNTPFLGRAIAAVINVFRPSELTEPEPTSIVDLAPAPVDIVETVEHSVSNTIIVPKKDVVVNNMPLPAAGSDSNQTVEHSVSNTNNFSYPGFGGGGAPTIQNSNPQEKSNSPPPEPLPEPEPPAPQLPSDTTPPDVSFYISECAGSLSADGCLLATTTINLFCSSSANDFDYFELTQNNQVSTTTATSTTISLLNNSINNFSIRAKDLVGNWSTSTAQSVEISLMPVIINEVAWGGTSGHSEDEWIELYNRTSKEINLNNWILRAEDGVPYINLLGTIPADGYYLIERSDDTTINDIIADLVVPFSGTDSGSGLGNTGENLILSYASTTIDQVPYCDNWCGGSSSYTAERYEPDIFIQDYSSNWGVNIHPAIIRNGTNVDGQPINGTPKARNSVNYLIAKGQGWISSDITLTKSRSPYIVNNTLQSFQASSTLTIEPGVVIKFNDGGISFVNNAKILAQGTSIDPITFTRFNDTGYWYGIEIQTTNNDSVFDYTDFEYGGSGVGNHDANLRIKDTSATITNSFFEYSKIYGLKLINSNSSISDNTFSFNNNELDSAGLYIESGTPNIQANTFANNRHGLYLIGSLGTINGNTFTFNSAEAILSSGYFGPIFNNSGSDNSTNAIVLSGGNITQLNSTTTLKTNSLPYVLNSSVSIVASSTLVTEPGVIVKGNAFGIRLDIYGNLFINGINSNDTVFTSNSSNPLKGDWGGISFYPGSYSNIRGATLEYANTAITYTDSPINLSNVKFFENNLAISANSPALVQTVEAATIEFLDNLATTTPSLW